MSDEELWNGLPSLPGVIPTPWLHINAAIGGFQPGSLVALASEDGSAKEASRIIVNQWPHVNCAVINHGDLGELARREGRASHRRATGRSGPGPHQPCHACPERLKPPAPIPHYGCRESRPADRRVAR